MWLKALMFSLSIVVASAEAQPKELLVERTDAHSVRFRGKDMLEVARFIEFVLNYEPGLAP